jgi:hypothetical protein
LTLMLNISKYHRAILGCSAIATASFAGFLQSANAAEQIGDRSVRAELGSVLIAQTNQSQSGGSNVSNTTGSNVSNTTGTNASNTTGSNASGSNGTRGGGFDAGTIARAGSIQTRFNNALANYDRAAAALAAVEANQPNASDTSPVRYAREVADAASCGCPNADTVGSTSSPRPELVAARAAEAEAATELAAAKAEARQFLESVKGTPTAANSSGSTPIW